MLTVNNISCLVQQKLLLKKIDLNFKSGKIYSILGPNGSGKTTLLKAIIGIQPIFSGSIFWGSQEVSLIKRRERSQIMTLVPQSPNVYFDFSVSEFVEMGSYASKCKLKELQLDDCLTQVDALHLKDQPVRTLSSGERQRVYIARSLLSNAPLMLFDEPTASLDIRHRLEIWKLIHDLKKLNKTIIIATHDFHDAKKWSDEIIVMQKGSIISTGDFATALQREVIQEVFGVSELFS